MARRALLVFFSAVQEELYAAMHFMKEPTPEQFSPPLKRVIAWLVIGCLCLGSIDPMIVDQTKDLHLLLMQGSTYTHSIATKEEELGVQYRNDYSATLNPMETCRNFISAAPNPTTSTGRDNLRSLERSTVFCFHVCLRVVD
jgi:hypothetical protein